MLVSQEMLPSLFVSNAGLAFEDLLSLTIVNGFDVLFVGPRHCALITDPHDAAS